MLSAEAVLFDMDGVVICTRQSVVDFWQALAEEHGIINLRGTTRDSAS